MIIDKEKMIEYQGMFNLFKVIKLNKNNLFYN